ncbi:MAG TPA: serine hydrolase [Saprospiraceae bacterium]|nr:serine hydrolase [Saprospiraceae bacterium]HMQ84302.1 serine hydrolase [Saprospiraceae bacterium]
MNRLLCSLLLLLALSFSKAQSLYFPPLSGETWDTLDPTALHWCPEKIEALLNFLDERNTKSFIVLKDGKIVLETYFDNFTDESIWYWASAGKSLMAVMVGLAQEDGYLALDDVTADYLGEGWTTCTEEEERLIKIRHQITMTTGLDDSLEDLGVPNSEYCYDPECLQCLTSPGNRWAYHNAPYRLVQNVMENATGINRTLYTYQRLGSRIGMSGFWFDYVYYSTARDMARFGLFMLAQGNWNGDLIMTDMDYYQAMIHPSQQLNPSYGYLWWLNGQLGYMIPGLQFLFDGSMIPDAPSDLFAALGRNDQKIYVVPSENMVVVRQGEGAYGDAPSLTVFDNELWGRIMDLPCPTAVDEEEAIASSIFPNPVRDVLYIRAENPLKNIRLYDLRGRLMKEQSTINANAFNLELNDLASGLYLLSIHYENGLQEHKKIAHQ